jgi:hypothetical protein
MFAKIFAQIFDSSISSDYLVRHVFMDLLVLADRDGVVDMTLDAIARRTNVPEEIVARALKELQEPDRKSRSHQEDGRRLIAIDSHRDWGWQIVNYDHYRNIKDEEARRTYFRDKKREQRKRLSSSVQDNPDCPTPSNSVKDSPTRSNNVTQAEGEADTEEIQKPSPQPRKRSAEPKHSTDPRHVSCKEAIFAYYRSKNEGDDPDWEGREGKALGMFLQANPKLTAEGMRRLLEHRSRSEVNHSERPGKWIPSVSGYRNGPLDKYGKPLALKGNGNGHGKQDHLIAMLEQLEAEDQAGVIGDGALTGSSTGSSNGGYLQRPA